MARTLPRTLTRGTTGYVLRRIAWLLPVLLVVIVVTFALMHLAPGSPWDRGLQDVRQQNTPLTSTTVRNLNEKFGLDLPWWQQLLRYLGNAVRGDFGVSYRFQDQQVRDIIAEAIPQTFVIGALAFAMVLVAGTGLGVLAALRHNTAVDHLVTGLATLIASVPNFVVGILLIVVLSVDLNRLTRGSFFLPDGGFGLDQHLVLPVLTLSLMPLAFIARLTRGSVLEVLRQDHVRTARAKGITERRVVLRHILRNAMVPIVTFLGPLFAYLVTGAVVVEALFQIPGLGGQFVDAVTYRDYPMILGTTVVYAAVISVANLVVDLVYVVVDPRMRPG